ncbi:Nucleic acid-binding OB-fold [Arabidopsis suecica]|uniref:Nucleic acid-binding OB-fold n=1 Tax=Arabidopsis suecica TaxID=45249 RepID=A0A8T2ANL7_ARASU|nr:Nucleic acid-binding OB-fold [Arabidopsis suecica]
MASNTSNDNFQHRPRQRNGPPPPRRQGRNPPPPSSSTRTSQNQPQQHTPQEKKKPVFVKVDQLKPGTSGHTLTVKVVDQNSVPQKPGAASSHLRPARISECLVGDETACILFTARNDQVDLMRPGATVNLRNAKIDMFKGSMRLAVDKWGRIEVTEPADITVKEDNNLSLVEYELVNVVEE